MSIIALGFFIIFICPVAIGLVVSRLTEPFFGALAGIVLFVIIVVIGYRNMMKIQQRGDHRNDKQ